MSARTILTLALVLLTTPAWANDPANGGARGGPPAESSGEVSGAQDADWELQDWELDIQRCLFTRARCSGSLTIIYESLQNARKDPGIEEWRVEYWEKKLRDYFDYNMDRHD